MQILKYFLFLCGYFNGISMLQEYTDVPLSPTNNSNTLKKSATNSRSTKESVLNQPDPKALPSAEEDAAKQNYAAILLYPKNETNSEETSCVVELSKHQHYNKEAKLLLERLKNDTIALSSYFAGLHTKLLAHQRYSETTISFIAEAILFMIEKIRLQENIIKLSYAKYWIQLTEALQYMYMPERNRQILQAIFDFTIELVELQKEKLPTSPRKYTKQESLLLRNVNNISIGPSGNIVTIQSNKNDELEKSVLVMLGRFNEILTHDDRQEINNKLDEILVLIVTINLYHLNKDIGGPFLKLIAETIRKYYKEKTTWQIHRRSVDIMHTNFRTFLAQISLDAIEKIKQSEKKQYQLIMNLINKFLAAKIGQIEEYTNCWGSKKQRFVKPIKNYKSQNLAEHLLGIRSQNLEPELLFVIYACAVGCKMYVEHRKDHEGRWERFKEDIAKLGLFVTLIQSVKENIAATFGTLALLMVIFPVIQFKIFASISGFVAK